MEPLSPALAGRFLTTGSPWSPESHFKYRSPRSPSLKEALLSDYLPLIHSPFHNFIPFSLRSPICYTHSWWFHAIFYRDNRSSQKITSSGHSYLSTDSALLWLLWEHHPCYHGSSACTLDAITSYRFVGISSRRNVSNGSFCVQTYNRSYPGMTWAFGINRYKLLHIEWISREVLLYSTGKYILR